MSIQRHPKLPNDPDFYVKVLDHLPTAVLVVRADGVLTYANEALVEMTGWGIDDGVGLNMLEVVHPDDHPFVVEAFTNVTSAPAEEQSIESSAWAPVRFRVVTRDGSVLPIEVTGGGGLTDPAVDGIIYTVRSCRDDELLAELFSGVASHLPIESACPPLVQHLALPPGGLDAVVFEQRADGSARCVVAQNDVLRDLPASSGSGVPWAGLASDPARASLASLPVAVRTVLAEAGYRSCFHTGAHSPDHDMTLRLVAFRRDDLASAEGALSRVGQARELLSIIAAKAHNDRLITSNSSRDDLTGLPNRLGLLYRFERLASTVDDCAVMFVDIDNFKQINDEYGHSAGDRVLSAVADRLVRTVRPDDFVCRIGGDEFAVVLSDSPGRLGTDTVRTVAERVVAILTQPVSHGGAPIPLAASVGVARAGHDRDFEGLMGRADGAMYRAKRAGGGRHHLDMTAA